MATTKAAEKLRLELEVWLRHEILAGQNIDRIKAELKAAEIPAAPPVGTALMVEVQFAHNPNMYEFLIKSVPGKGYYTTGTLPENSYFATWAALWAYFNSNDVVRRTPFYVMSKVPLPGSTLGTELDRRTEF